MFFFGAAAFTIAADFADLGGAFLAGFTFSGLGVTHSVLISLYFRKAFFSSIRAYVSPKFIETPLSKVTTYWVYNGSFN